MPSTLADRAKDPLGANPTGCYRTYFSIPSSWQGLGDCMNVFVVLDGTESAVAVFVDGHYVGYSQVGEVLFLWLQG